jgi:hypothetical protein
MQQGWLRNQDAAPDRLAKYFNALGPFAEIVEAVYDSRSSGLSSGFGCKNNSHSSNGNGSLPLLPSMVIPARIDQMSTINSRPL